MLILLFVLVLQNKSVFGKSNAETFNYPINVGTKEWALLNHGEKVLALQIPNEVLLSVSTEKLIDLIVTYPCFFFIVSCDDYYTGFNIIREHFNAIDVAFERADAGHYLLEKYTKYDLENAFCKMEEQELFDILLEMLYVEVLLAQPEIYEKMSVVELNRMLDLVEKNYQIRTSHKDKTLYYSAFYECLVAYQGLSANNFETTLLTPNGTPVTVIVINDTDIYYNYRTSIKNSIEANYPGASVVGDATIRYNCHAYAWANINFVWMNDPSAYWLDGSYSLQSMYMPSAIGQKIFYPGTNNEHSGVVVRLSGNKIRSKWGPQSLVEHDVENCPYFFIPLAVRYYA